MKKIIKGLKAYFNDRRNRIVHIIVGISALIASVFTSIDIFTRLSMFGAAIGFNMLRMKIIP